MDAKKLVAFVAVLAMLLVPFAAIVGETEASDDVEVGSHLSLENLNKDQLMKIFSDTKESNSTGDKLYYAIAGAVLMPGINPFVFMYGTVKEVTVENASLELDYTQYVSSDKTDLTLKVAGEVNVEKLTIKVNTSEFKTEAAKITEKYGVDVDTVLFTPEVRYALMQTVAESSSFSIGSIAPYLNSLCNGEYADKLIDDFKDTKVPTDLTLTCTANLKVYGEVSMKQVKTTYEYKYGKDGEERADAYVFKEGGVPLSYDILSSIPGLGDYEGIVLPLSALKVDLKATIDTTIGEKDASFDVGLKVDVGANVERHYEIEDLTKVVPYIAGKGGKLESKGTQYYDEATSAKLIISEYNKYNGKSNIRLLDLDLSNTLKGFIDGYIGMQTKEGFSVDYPVFSDNASGYNFYNQFRLMRASEIPVYLVSTGYKDVWTKAGANAPSDDGFLAFLKNTVGVEEKNIEINHNYGDAKGEINSIKDKIDGKTSNNMMVVGIVIAVIVILALVALWYFKFRPQE